MTNNTDNDICDSLLQSLLQAIECAKNDDCRKNVDYPMWVARHRRDAAVAAFEAMVQMVEEVKRQYGESLDLACEAIQANGGQQ